MKIKPVILCGGAGTRLWPNSKNNIAKQFIDFGGWCLFEKTLERIKSPTFDYPIISTNEKYIKIIKNYLKKKNIKKYKIILEPSKKNTAPAVLASALIKDIPYNQPLIFLSADHIVEKSLILNKAIKKNTINLTDENVIIFGIKPTSPSSEYGYFLTKKNKMNLNKVTKFIEKPDINKAKKIIKNKGYWNSGMFFLRKDSIIKNFKKYSPVIYKNCSEAMSKAKVKKNVYYLNKVYFNKIQSKSFDKAILEKAKKINAIKLNLTWSDLGSWKEICKMYNINKKKYLIKKNNHYRPWGKYTNLFKGKGFLVKELHIKPDGILSLQKHHHRSEHWLVTEGNPKITINKKIIYKKKNESIFVPLGTVHRIENPFKNLVKIIEIQIGSILKENDIIRYEDAYGRIK